jgi:hypothetical protein
MPARSANAPSLVEIRSLGTAWHIHEINAFGSFLSAFSSSCPQMESLTQPIFTVDGDADRPVEEPFGGLTNKNVVWEDFLPAGSQCKC